MGATVSRSGVGSEHFQPPIGSASSTATRRWMRSASSIVAGRQNSGSSGPGRASRRAATRCCAAASMAEGVIAEAPCRRKCATPAAAVYDLFRGVRPRRPFHHVPGEIPMRDRLTPAACLPRDHADALLVGRIHVPSLDGPVPVQVRADGVYDLSSLALTVSDLLELPDAAARIRAAGALPRLAPLEPVLANSTRDGRTDAPAFLAPCDLQAIKASGVTFVSSMLE